MKMYPMCKVRDHVTSDQFGCEPGYFNEFIKDQHLIIISDDKGVLQTISADSEEWYINPDDVELVEDRKEEVAI